MSHIVEIKTEIRDATALQAACQRLNLAEPAFGTFKLFSREMTGWGIDLPNWRYPVVCDLAEAKISFDNFGGRWGQQPELDRLLQAYACEKAKLEARRQGHSVTEQSVPDGSIKLVIHVGDSSANH